MNKNKIFIDKAKLVHGTTYDYSKVDYVNNKTKVTIICPIHKEFEQAPSNHLAGKKCKKCSNIISSDKQKITTKEFIEKAKSVHGNKYDYSKVNYVNKRTKVQILCKIHKEFEQLPSGHLQGKGCRFCSESKGELVIAKFLDKHNIKYEREKTFKELGLLRFDFYLPHQNLFIEFDGIQHFVSVEYWGGIVGLNKIQNNDSIKNKFCDINKFKLIRINYTNYRNIDKIMTRELL